MVPPPLAPLLPTPTARSATTHLHGDVFELGIAAQVEEFVEGGLDPRLSVGSAVLLTRGSLADRGWQVEVLSGRTHSWAESSSPELDIRWKEPQGPSIAMIFQYGDRFQASLEQREGTMRGSGLAAMALAEGVDLALEGFHSRHRGSLRAALGEYPEIAVEWSGVRSGAEGGLRCRVGNLGALHASLARTEGKPGDLEAAYVLRTRSRSSGWSLGWVPEQEGPWLELVTHHGEVASTASTDTAGSSRTFHDLLLRSSVHRSAGGWIARRWRSDAGWSRMVVETPPSSYFAPFLSWNAFNPSSWAPVEQILSDQREHLHGTLEIRRLHAGGSWKAARGRARMECGAEVSWWALDPRLLHRTTRMSFLGAGYRTESDTLDSWRLRAWTLSPSLDLAWNGGFLGEVSASGRATIPLAMRRLGPSRPEPLPDAPRESWRGLWNAALGWRRSF